MQIPGLGMIESGNYEVVFAQDFSLIFSENESVIKPPLWLCHKLYLILM